MEVDFGKLWEWLEQPITVTLRTKIAEGSYNDNVIDYCYKSADNDEGMLVDGVILQGTTCKFHLWTDRLDLVATGLRPFEEDEIWIGTDGAEGKYVVKSVGVEVRKKRYDCVCLALVS